MGFFYPCAQQSTRTDLMLPFLRPNCRAAEAINQLKLADFEERNKKKILVDRAKRSMMEDNAKRGKRELGLPRDKALGAERLHSPLNSPRRPQRSMAHDPS